MDNRHTRILRVLSLVAACNLAVAGPSRLEAGNPPGGPQSQCFADVVFIIDTSGSMSDEINSLCAVVEDVQAALAANSIIASTYEYRIVMSSGVVLPPGCVENVIVAEFGSDVPGPIGGGCVDPFPDTQSGQESWGPATAVIAEEFPWTPGRARIVVPISDENPCLGSEFNPTGVGPIFVPGPGDAESIQNAIAVCNQNNVYAFPIRGNVGSLGDAPLEENMTLLASGTGGQMLTSDDAATDIAIAIQQLVFITCEENFPEISCPLGTDLSAVAGSVFSFPIEATDPNGEVLTLSLATGPAGLFGMPALPLTGVASVSTICSWLPPAAGTYPVQFEAMDGDQQIALLDITIAVTESTEESLFVRGDFEGNGTTDLSDPIQMIYALFVPGSDLPECMDAVDANDDGSFNVADAVYTLEALFMDGAPGLPAPNPSCGNDSTADSLECVTAQLNCSP